MSAREPTDDGVPRVPPKIVPWPWAILLLLLLPLFAVGMWFGGTRHRIDDHPPKVSHKLVGMRPAPRPMAPAPSMRAAPTDEMRAAPVDPSAPMRSDLEDPFHKDASPGARPAPGKGKPR